MTRTQPLLIVADAYHQAYMYAREHDLGPEHTGWRYIHTVDQVQGERGMRGRYVNISTAVTTVRDMQRRDEVAEYLRAHGWEEVVTPPSSPA